jgi:hypothetical protein
MTLADSRRRSKAVSVHAARCYHEV